VKGAPFFFGERENSFSLSFFSFFQNHQPPPWSEKVAPFSSRSVDGFIPFLFAKKILLIGLALK